MLIVIFTNFLLIIFRSTSIHSFCFRRPLTLLLIKEIWLSEIAIELVRYFFLNLKLHHFVHSFSYWIAVWDRGLEFLKPLFWWHWSIMIISNMLILGIWFELILGQWVAFVEPLHIWTLSLLLKRLFNDWMMKIFTRIDDFWSLFSVNP